jgi:hypothetical protein
MFVSLISSVVRFVLCFVRAGYLGNRKLEVCDGFGYHIGPIPYDTQILFAAHRRPLYPTVALDSPPFV